MYIVICNVPVGLITTQTKPVKKRDKHAQKTRTGQPDKNRFSTDFLRVFTTVRVTDNDIAGGALNELPERCSAATLRKFLSARRIPSAGLRKADLVKLAEDVLQKKIGVAIDAEKGSVVVEKARQLRNIDLNARSTNLDVFPVTGWKPFPSTEIPKAFHFGSIYKHLIESASVVDSDGEIDGPQNFSTKKPLARGRQYFRSGHVKNLQDALTRSNRYCVKGWVKSSMKEVDYPVMVMIGSQGDILDAECDCRGSALMRCSHVGAVLIAIEDYVSLFGYSPPACTSTVCQWNQGGKEKRADPVYLFQYSNIRNPARAINFDANIVTHPMQVNNGLLSLSTDESLFPNGTKWETILEYQYEDYVLNEERKAILAQLVEKLQTSLTFGFGRPTEVPGTRAQSTSTAWLGLRRLYITASVIKKFLRAPRGDVAALLRSHMWFPTTFTSKYTTWGVENEGKAKQAYSEKSGNTVLDSGLYVNPAFPGLAASPDGVVFCKNSGTWGVLEVKCPWILKDHFPTDFEEVLKPQQKNAFCLKKDNGQITLKATHDYNYQVQMVMGVVGVQWCDFIIWTPKNIWYTRISFNPSFWQEVSSELVSFHKRYIAVEYFEMKTPRRLPLATID